MGDEKEGKREAVRSGYGIEKRLLLPGLLLLLPCKGRTREKIPRYIPTVGIHYLFSANLMKVTCRKCIQICK